MNLEQFTIKINGSPYTVYIKQGDKEGFLNAIKAMEAGDTPASHKLTGFEMVDDGELYYGYDSIPWPAGDDPDYDKEQYTAGDYFSVEKVAANVTRAVRLLMRLIRFSAVHDADAAEKPWAICFIPDEEDLKALRLVGGTQNFGISFSSRYLAQMAMEEFREDLLWYFVTFLPSLKDRY